MVSMSPHTQSLPPRPATIYRSHLTPGERFCTLRRFESPIVVPGPCGVLKWSGLRANRTDSIRLPQPRRTPSITPTTESVEPSIAQKADRRTSSSTEVLAANAPSISATLARSSAGAWCRGMA